MSEFCYFTSCSQWRWCNSNSMTETNAINKILNCIFSHSCFFLSEYIVGCCVIVALFAIGCHCLRANLRDMCSFSPLYHWFSNFFDCSNSFAHCFKQNKFFPLLDLSLFLSSLFISFLSSICCLFCYYKWLRAHITQFFLNHSLMCA